jgi:hypothetical protein
MTQFRGNQAGRNPAGGATTDNYQLSYGFAAFADRYRLALV